MKRINRNWLGALWVGVVVLSLSAGGCGGGGSGGGGSASGSGSSDTTAPQITEAIATSATTILVSFSEPMDDTTGDPVRYSLVPGGVITAAELSEFKTQILLTTLPLTPGLSYTLSSSTITDAAGNTVDPEASSRTVVYHSGNGGPGDGGDTTAPRLTIAVATSATTILVSFSESMNEGTGDPARYSLTPGGVITGASLSQFKNQVLLTALPLTPGLTYTVSAPTVTDIAGNTVDSTANSGTVVFGTVDERAPQLLRVTALDNTTIRLTFSEPLAESAANPARYSLIPPVTILNAQLSEDRTQVTLSTAPMQPTVEYYIMIDGIADGAGNPLPPMTQPAPVPSSDTSPGGTTELPRVVGAASTSNTTVIVKFSKSMADNALNPANYFVELQPNVGVLTLASRCDGGAHKGHLCASGALLLKVCGGGPYPGRICQTKATCGIGGTCDENPCGTSTCVGARFVGTDRTEVELQTISQNDGIYTITATGTTDLAGNPLAPRQVIAGAVVDPTTAEFLGTGPVADGGIEGNAGVDSDGDGMPDTDEQSGWDINVRLQNGEEAPQHVTANPLYADTDGDGLVDPVEFTINTNPRSNDSDGDGLTDAEEYNTVYSDPTNQDTDGDTISDALEVETFKTNAILADSDGDGYSDSEELFEMGRDPRIADVPRTRITVASERLQLDERFTYTDENGDTQSDSSSTTTSMQNVRETSRDDAYQEGKDIFFSITGGIEDCQADCKEGIIFGGGGLLARLKLEATAGANFSYLTSSDNASATQAIEAFDRSVEKGKEISHSHAVTREVVGAQFDASVTLENTSDVAFSLSNVEITVQATDPQNPSRLVPVAALRPGSGDDPVFNLGPLVSRQAVLFSNHDVFPNLVEDLMKAPRAFLYQVTNYDISTEDGRNFAFGLQDVRDRTAEIVIDFGDGKVRSQRVITAGVLNRPRAQGGTIIGGFEGFGGTGRPRGIPLDFALQDILHLRKSHPAVIVAGANKAADTMPNPKSDDILLALPQNVAAHTAVIAPGRNGILETKPTGDDVIAGEIAAGTDGIADTKAQGDDVQIVSVGSGDLAADAVVVDPGPNGLLDTSPIGDDEFRSAHADGILAGPDRSVRSVASGDDVQLVPVGTDGVPLDTVVISAGDNGVLDTTVAGDDVADIVTGYEVSRSCSASTTAVILTGADGIADSLPASGVCESVDSSHEKGDACRKHTDCGGTGGLCSGTSCRTAFGGKTKGMPCTTNAACGVDPDTEQTGVCGGDTIVLALGKPSPPDSAAHVLEAGPNGSIDSIALGDDVLLGPGIPCVSDSECPGGTCSGPENVVRVERRRRGQFGRQWVLVMPDETQFQTDFGQVRIRPGQTLGLSFIQDIDRDGLTSMEERLHTSSDFLQDTDGDDLDDFVEERLGWDVGVVGQPIRHVFSDPSRPDSDGDGLTDREESDLRELGVPLVGDEPTTAFATDPRLRDTDSDGVSDKQEVFGYLTGAGILDPQPQDYYVGEIKMHPVPAVVLAGADLVADTRACGGNYCLNDSCVRGSDCLSGICEAESANAVDKRCYCSNKGDCLSRNCVLKDPLCDDVQVVPKGERVLNARTVVVAAGPNRGLTTTVDASKDVLVSMSADPPIASSFALGDDVQVVAGNASVLVSDTDKTCRDKTSFPMCAVIKPGADGEFSTNPGGDDILAFGQSLEASNPLNPDTDFDEIRDGIEQILGSSPNDPVDTGTYADRDHDGLTDNQESQLGWKVFVYTSAGHCSVDSMAVCYRTGDCRQGQTCMGVGKKKDDGQDVFSNRNIADSDGDGLPDYAERHLPCFALPTCDQHKCSNNGFACDGDADCANECPTDPTNEDTDGDGLSDLDELSSDQLADLAQFAELFTGYRLDNSTSKKYGTDPTRVDSDGDGLSDSFELLTGWSVRLANTGSAKRVFSDPKQYDSDADGLSDGAECGIDAMAPAASRCKGLEGAIVQSPNTTGPTDPTVADTDGDNRLDGVECSESKKKCTTNPLLAERSLAVTVTFTSLRVDSYEYGDKKANGDFVFGLNLQQPNETYPGSAVVTQLTPGILARVIDKPGVANELTVLDALFTSSDCVSGGAAPGRTEGDFNSTTPDPSKNATKGIYACGLAPGRELSLAHRTRCSVPEGELRPVCTNYNWSYPEPFPGTMNFKASDACAVLCNGGHNCAVGETCDATGCFGGEAICRYSGNSCDCVDSAEPRKVDFEVRTGQGFVVNGFMNGLREGTAARCARSGTDTSSPSCSKDSDCGQCEVQLNKLCTKDADCISGLCINDGVGACNARSQATYCEMSFVKQYNFESLRPGFSFETYDLVSSDGKCTAKVFAEITVK